MLASYGERWRIDDVLTFYVNTHDPSTGGEVDAASAPTYRVYENETGTPILTGSMAKLDDSNTTGFYSEAITLSAANGFEVGKCYAIRVAGAIDTGSPDTTGVLVIAFRMAPTIAESAAAVVMPATADAILAWLAGLATHEGTHNRGTGVRSIKNAAGSVIATATDTDTGGSSGTFTRGKLT